MKMFRRRVVMEADVFALDTEQNVDDTRIARGAKCGLTPEQSLQSDLVDLFSSRGGKSRAEQALAKFPEMKGVRSGCMAADLSVNCSVVGRCGPWLPTCTRGMEPVLIRHEHDTYGHLYTPREIGFAMGFPMIRVDGNEKYEDCIGLPLHTLPMRQQQLMQGNGIHLVAIGSLLTYIWSHTVKKDLVLEFLPPLRSLSTAASADESAAVSLPAAKARRCGTADFEFDDDESAAALSALSAPASAAAEDVTDVEADDGDMEE